MAELGDATVLEAVGLYREGSSPSSLTVGCVKFCASVFFPP
jgi:hypothetical protein